VYQSRERRKAGDAVKDLGKKGEVGKRRIMGRGLGEGKGRIRRWKEYRGKE